MTHGFRSSKLTLVDDKGHRKYLTEAECQLFLMQSEKIDRVNQMFCALLYYTGCRPSEALELSVGRISLDENLISFRSMKKRKFDKHGNEAKAVFRQVPVPPQLIKGLDLVFDLRNKTRFPSKRDERIFTKSRTAMFRMVKKTMLDAGVRGPQASAKALRHSYALRLAKAKVCITVIKKLLGHTDLETTEVYLQFSLADTAFEVNKVFNMQQNSSELHTSEFANRAVA